jgi:hypothetical protein
MGNEVEVVDATTTDVVLYDPNLFPELKWADPDDANRRFADRFQRAEDLDDLFDVLSGNNTKGMIGRRVEVQAVEWQAFQSERGVIPNGICLAADIDTGEVLEFATTSGFCTMFLRKAELLGLLPIKLKITEKVTKSGQKAINFEKV